MRRLQPGRLTLVHVAPSLAVLRGGLGGWEVTDEADPLAAPRAWLAAQAARVPEAEERLLCGDPPGQVAAGWAREAGVDLIVSAAYGDRVQRALLGSFSRDLAYAAPCPVLVARPRPARGAEAATNGAAAPYGRIVACLDDTPSAGRVIEMVRELRGRMTVEATLVHVVAPPRLLPRRLVAQTLPMPSPRRLRAQRLLRRAATRIEGAETVVLAGHPPHEACRLAAAREIDLLIAAPRDAGPRGLGGFAAHLASSAPCSVLLV